MATRTVTIHDRCTVQGCNRLLHSIAEGERGTCVACWVQQMPPDDKRKMNRLIACAFNGASEEEKAKAVDDVREVIRKQG